MQKPTLESLQLELERQDRKLEEAIRAVGSIDERDIPPGFFDELEEACRPRLAQPVAAPSYTFHFGLRA